MSNPISTIPVSNGRIATYSQGPWSVVLSEYDNGLPSDIVYAGYDQGDALRHAVAWANGMAS